MDDFFRYDPQASGSKGLVYIGDKIIVFRRTADAPTHPNELDLPGGGPEGGETPFETFQREVWEECGLKITEKDVVYARRYPSRLQPGKFGWFPVVKFPAETEADIVFGNEGADLTLMTTTDYLARTDAWETFQERSKDYLAQFESAGQ